MQRYIWKSCLKILALEYKFLGVFMDKWVVDVEQKQLQVNVFY